MYAEPGDEINWNIAVTNLSNVSKEITIAERLIGASLSEMSFTLSAGETKTISACYTVRNSDVQKKIVNEIIVNDGTENKNITDEGTLILGSSNHFVKWLDEDKETLLDGPKIFNEGALIPTSDIKPTKAEDEVNTYEFAGWSDPITDGDGNITYIATYTAHKKYEEIEPTYTVIYKDENNSFKTQITKELKEGDNTPKFKEETGKTQNLEDGTVIPIREGYRFIGWSKRINKVVSSEDANENYEIIYIAMWQKNINNADNKEGQNNNDNKTSDEVKLPQTGDKIIKYIISGILSTLLVIVVILKNKQTLKNK